MTRLMRLHQRERGIHGNRRYCVEISGCVSIKESGIHGEENRRCKIITLPMKRARARERAHVIDILPYTVIFFVWASNTTRAGWLLSQSVMRWYQPAHFFMCMLPSLRWDEQDSPQRCLHHLHNVYTALYDV